MRPEANPIRASALGWYCQVKQNRADRMFLEGLAAGQLM